MDPFTIGAILMAAGGVASIMGNNAQAEYEREQARIALERSQMQATWQKDQLGEQIDDLGRQKDAAVGTLLTNSAAVGISGPSVLKAKGATLGEYNRAIARLEEGQRQIDVQGAWAQQDYESFVQQSETNQTFNNISTILGTGSQMAGGYYNRSQNTASVTPTATTFKTSYTPEYTSLYAPAENVPTAPAFTFGTGVKKTSYSLSSFDSLNSLAWSKK